MAQNETGFSPDNQVDRSPPSNPSSFIRIMHANYLLATSKTVTPWAQINISMYVQHPERHTLQHAHSLSHMAVTAAVQLSMQDAGTFTMKLEKNPLTKPVKSLWRLMIHYIYDSAEKDKQRTLKQRGDTVLHYSQNESMFIRMFSVLLTNVDIQKEAKKHITFVM